MESWIQDLWIALNGSKSMFRHIKKQLRMEDIMVNIYKVLFPIMHLFIITKNLVVWEVWQLFYTKIKCLENLMLNLIAF